LAISNTRPVTEADPHNWTGGGAYIEARIAAEDLVMRYVREAGLPAVALCISTTYGPGDWAPTPHGGAIRRVALGKLPFNMGFALEVVGIEDAARAMLLAAEHGRSGERYIISDTSMATKEIHRIAAQAVGVKPPKFDVPLPVLYAGARVNDIAAVLLRRDLPFATVGVRMAEQMSALDHSKAERELGWKPEPVADSIAKAARFFAHEWTPA
jgi:nucleoside-diphosphate-sugar epimerase